MHVRMHKHLSKIVTGMSRFTASGLDKNSLFYSLMQTVSFISRTHFLKLFNHCMFFFLLKTNLFFQQFAWHSKIINETLYSTILFIKRYLRVHEVPSPL